MREILHYIKSAPFQKAAKPAEVKLGSSRFRRCGGDCISAWKAFPALALIRNVLAHVIGSAGQCQEDAASGRFAIKMMGELLVVRSSVVHALARASVKFASVRNAGTPASRRRWLARSRSSCSAAESSWEVGEETARNCLDARLQTRISRRHPKLCCPMLHNAA